MAVLGSLFWVNVGQAQETYTIKLKERDAGATVAVTKSEITSAKVTVTDGGGNVVVDNRNVTKDNQIYVETVLERQPGKPPTKLQRQYTKAERSTDDRLQESALQGKTVLIEKKDGSYTFMYKGGGTIDATTAAALAKEFSKKSETDAELERLLLPNGAVAVGGSWKIDMPKVVQELAKQGPMKLNVAKSAGQGKLMKAYKRDGRQYGELKFSIEIPITSIGEGKGTLVFGDGVKIVLDLTLDTCIDGATEAGKMQMKMRMAGNATIPDAPGASATLDISVEASQIQSDVKKK